MSSWRASNVILPNDQTNLTCTLTTGCRSVSDVAVFIGIVAGAAGAMSAASTAGADLAVWDPVVTLRGGEIAFATKEDFVKARANPTGDWDNPNPLARRPHYHRRGPGGTKAHHPWEKRW